jgi:anti-sigma28 factor (negative regulator of flagellin synthesis)
MEISLINKGMNVKPQQVQDLVTDPSKNISTEENAKYTLKNKVDSAEISSSHNGSFEDKRISVAKSAILYDVSVGSSLKTIQDLKSSVEKGTYEVPSNLIADEILK